MAAIQDSRKKDAGRVRVCREKCVISLLSRANIGSAVLPFLLFLTSSITGCALWSNTCATPRSESTALQTIYALRLEPSFSVETQGDGEGGPAGSEESVLEMLDQEKNGDIAPNQGLEIYPDPDYLAGETGIFSPLVIDGEGIYLARPLDPLYLEI